MEPVGSPKRNFWIALIEIIYFSSVNKMLYTSSSKPDRILIRRRAPSATPLNTPSPVLLAFIIFRGEYMRIPDWPDKPFFEKKNQPDGASTQPTVLLGLIAYPAPYKK